MSKRSLLLILVISILLISCQKQDTKFVKVLESTNTVGEVHIEIQKAPVGQAINLDSTKPKLDITSPTEGEILRGGTVTVKVKAEGIDVVDYSKNLKLTPGQGHFHFFIDQGNYIYSYFPSYTYTNVPTGEHEVEVFLANNDHTNLNPPVVAKVKFVMKS